MNAFRSLRSRSAAPLTVAAAGLWASLRFESRRTAAEPAAVTRQSSQQHPAENPGHGEEGQSRATGDGESGKKTFPPPTGPMVAVFLDESSVHKLKAHFPEARDGQLRKVVVQYGPSASERQAYRHLFGGAAEVTVTGDASSFARRALVASVSHAGRLVEPVSLSAAIDISPPVVGDAPGIDDKDGPGPLASAALIEQIKEAGAMKEELWEGALPPLLAHDRQFPSELGAYVKLKEPIKVRGTICRADWVDGASNVCRDKLEGGEDRQEDWQPSDCSICAFFSVSPCNDIFNRFVATSKRRDEYLKTFEPENQQGEDVEDGEHISQGKATAAANAGGESNSQDSSAADSGVTTVGRTSTPRVGRRASTTPPGERAFSGKKEKGHDTAGDGLGRQAERDLIEEQLEKETLQIFNEMKECMIFHDLY
eukprot:g13502.t2